MLPGSASASQLDLRKETRKEVHGFNGAPHGAEKDLWKTQWTISIGI
jgi:hypothetical protein